MSFLKILSINVRGLNANREKDELYSLTLNIKKLQFSVFKRPFLKKKMRKFGVRNGVVK